MTGKSQNRASVWKKLTLVDLDEPTLFFDYAGDLLNVNATRTKLLLKSTARCSNPEFLLEQLRNCQDERNFRQKLSRGHLIGKVMRRTSIDFSSSGWKWWSSKQGVETLCIGFVFVFCTSQFVWTCNCLMCAFKLSWNACIWHEVADLTFFGP